ncbi:MAG: tRNA (N(6)-L-threonylcarbamoyladenosine(37)-C(2))-methylthiotransferase MtaB [Acidobacteria bacterium]|nr:MAG: tRNA (N(6)-L-threonylcarbamoyladenosine(37)-C(2))-methylthiotransferase MtaB [Acidobacteriota bacterium]
MATFHLLNFGCRASQADGAALKAQLLQAGLEEAPGAEPSDVAVLNTCTVTAVADAEVRRVIRRLHRSNPRCRVLVTGCYAQRAPQEIARLEGVAWVVGNSHKHTVAELVKAEFAPGELLTRGDAGLVQIAPRSASTEVSGVAAKTAEAQGRSDASRLGSPAVGSEARVLVGAVSDEFHFVPVSAPPAADDRTRPTLKVQDGCNARCSFCVIPYVRGASRSLALDCVIGQVRDLERQGYKEIVLSGINLGSYGRDLDSKMTFLGLLEKLLAETSIARLRISSIEPMDITPELIRLAAREPRLARHFHVPLQSGCDRILRLMNRRYWTSQYAERILAIHERVPNCGIGADVMVGFPGETDEDHRRSLRFIESLPFTYLHIFPYSARPNTPAAASCGQVEGRVSHERSREIRSVIEEKRRSFLAAQVSRTLSVLTLEEARPGEKLERQGPEDEFPVALSSNYVRVALPGVVLPRNTLLDVRVGRAARGLLYGYPEARLV